MAEKENIAGIGPALAAIFIPIVLFVLLFDKGSSWILPPIAFCFVLLGIGVAYFASKDRSRR